MEKIHKSHAKEYEKVLKSISQPLKEGRHFDQGLGGVAGLFENMRVNTQVHTYLQFYPMAKAIIAPKTHNANLPRQWSTPTPRPRKR